MKKTLSKSRSKSKYMSKHKKRHMPKHKKSKSKSKSKHKNKHMSKSLTKYNKKYRKKKMTKKMTKKRTKKRGGDSGAIAAGVGAAAVVAGLGIYGVSRYMSKGNNNDNKGANYSQSQSSSYNPQSHSSSRSQSPSSPNHYEFTVNNSKLSDSFNEDFKANEGILYNVDDNTKVDYNITYGDLQSIIQLYMDDKDYNSISIKIPYRQGIRKFKSMRKFVEFVGDRSALVDDTPGQFMANVPFGKITINYS